MESIERQTTTPKQIEIYDESLFDDEPFDDDKLEESDIEADEKVLGCDYDEAFDSLMNNDRKPKFETTRHSHEGSEEKKERMIKYDLMIRRSNNAKPMEISFDDVDKYDFENKAFIEFIISQDYVHLYFDFDSMLKYDERMKEEEKKKNGIDEIVVDDDEKLKRLDGVIEWLNSLKTVFGEYSIGGYTDNEAVANKYHLRLYPEGHHYVSVHVVFYQTMISTKDLVEIMKWTAKDGFQTKGVHELCDYNVYKLVSRKENETTRQLFRHVLSNKIYQMDKKKKGFEQNKANHGVIINGTKPSQQIVQVRGNERIVSREEWSKVFQIPNFEEKQLKKRIKQQLKKNGEKAANDEIGRFDTLECCEKLIKLNEDDFDKLLANFTSDFDNLKTIGALLLHSPFDKDFVHDILEKWYFKMQHQNEWSVDVFVSKYYQKEFSNRWFYSIVNRIDDETIRDEWKNRFKYYSVDEDAKIDLNDETFTLSSLNKTNYKLDGGVGINAVKFLSDLKRVCVCVNKGKQYFVLKDYDDVRNTTTLTYLYPKQFKERMISINIGKYYKDGKLREATAWGVYNAGANKNLFLKDGLRFYDERPDFFSYFNGYNYRLMESVDMTKIDLYLKHIREVIADNDEIVYNFILDWVSFIFQNISGKTGIAFVITGKQGTGKNIFTNEICNLMKRYSNPNVSNIDNVIGKFNVAIENMKLIVCNEMTSAETNKYLNSDALKTVTTENVLDINQKNEPVRTIENVVNLIFVSNHFVPVKVDEDDRRYFMVETSDKYKGDFGYFDRLVKSFEADGFHENLLTFFMKRDISRFDPRKIPMTKTKREVLNSTKTSYRLFVEEYIEEFSKREGWNCKEAFDYFKAFCQSNNFIACASNKLGEKLRDYVEHKRVRVGDKREYRYFIKEGFKVDDDGEEVVDLDVDVDVHI